MPGGLTGGEISAIISSPPPAIPRILFPVRVRVSQGISSLLLLKRVNPEYPDAARRARVQGTVVMHAVIGKDGSVSKLELVSGHPMLVPVAMDAAKQWKYKPYLLNGQAMEVDTEILINFALPGIR